jgi:Xaa-Pro aminopeptidase
MVEDGAAMCEFYAWFEAASGPRRAASPRSPSIAAVGARAARPGFVGLSFPVIAGFNANGAMPHYRAHAGSEAVSFIEGDGLLLIDSGGQYLGGTTDITRVWPVGPSAPAMKRDYTLVLKGTMALSRPCSRAARSARCSMRSPAHRCGPRGWTSVTAPAMAWGTS